MTIVKSLAIVAALAGGTSLAIAQSGPQTPSATGKTAGNSAAPAPNQQCVGIRHGLTECRTMHTSTNSYGTSKMAASPTIAMHGSDTVILSTAQRRAVWNDLRKQASNQNVAGFDAMIGTFVPNTVKAEPIPSNVTANNPSLQPYDFAMVNHELVIVDPANKVIADVLSK
jgi:hypothetical protein